MRLFCALSFSQHPEEQVDERQDDGEPQCRPVAMHDEARDDAREEEDDEAVDEQSQESEGQNVEGENDQGDEGLEDGIDHAQDDDHDNERLEADEFHSRQKIGCYPHCKAAQDQVGEDCHRWDGKCGRS